MKTAVIYARYSSERQTEQSIEGQIRECTAFAKRNDILIVNTYIDRAMTGTNDNRTDFQRMLKDWLRSPSQAHATAQPNEKRKSKAERCGVVR